MLSDLDSADPLTWPEVPGPSGPAPADAVLRRLIGVDPGTFAQDYWGRQALLSKAADLPQSFGDLLSAAAVDELVSQRGLRTPFLRVAQNGSTLSDRAFTAGGGVGAGVADQVSDTRLVELFAGGATLVLQALHRVWPAVIELCGRLAGELGHPVQANAYVTPPQNQGFNDHYDVHDVFVLQIEGRKRWQIHPPVLAAPLRDQPWNERRRAVERRAAEEPLLEAVLEAGDCLYLPRGFLHSAKALGGVSTHLTLGVHVWTRYRLAEELVSQALSRVADSAQIRGSLPLGVAVNDPATYREDVEQVRGALLEAVRQADAEELAQALGRADRDTRRPAPIGPLQQLQDAAELTPDTELSLRGQLAAVVEQEGEVSVLKSRAGRLELAEAEQMPAKALLEHHVATVADLGPELARRTLLAGVTVVRH